MTGKELIIYILQNNLEDKEIHSLKGAAAAMRVGPATVSEWCIMGQLPTVSIDDTTLIFGASKGKKR